MTNRKKKKQQSPGGTSRPRNNATGGRGKSGTKTLSVTRSSKKRTGDQPASQPGGPAARRQRLTKAEDGTWRRSPLVQTLGFSDPEPGHRKRDRQRVDSALVAQYHDGTPSNPPIVQPPPPPPPNPQPGRVMIPPGQPQGVFDAVYRGSSTFRAMVDQVLQRGDIEYIITSDNVSFYDRAGSRRIISIGLNLPGGVHRTDSDIIFEMCNAWADATGLKPDMSSFIEPEAYGSAVERSEWEAAQRHYQIMKEMERLDPGYALLNRFAPGFERPDRPWTDFQNYYDDQRHSGHTDHIIQHHPNY
ncbi:hypothetical protein [Sorangium sp. So ce1097]|uniref:hypothetical protein n=1 Tax=Sorangium sp. So ce1097 TaxID=3133330 RepID=UPI003F633CA4